MPAIPIFPVVDALSVLTLIGGIIVIVLGSALLVQLRRKKTLALVAFVDRHALLLMLIVATVATCGSLFLSEIAGWTPCKDCWFQRIFMYPQVLLLAIALWKRDRGIAASILALSSIGAIIAIDHYHEQIVATFFTPPDTSLVPCDDTGVSCAKTYTFRFGYITIPMMALTAFLLNALGSLTVLRRAKR